MDLCYTLSTFNQTLLSFHVQTFIPSLNWWIIGIICGGTPRRASTKQRRVRSTETHVFCRLMKQSSGDDGTAEKPLDDNATQVFTVPFGIHLILLILS